MLPRAQRLDQGHDLTRKAAERARAIGKFDAIVAGGRREMAAAAYRALDRRLQCARSRGILLDRDAVQRRQVKEDRTTLFARTCHAVGQRLAPVRALVTHGADCAADRTLDHVQRQLSSRSSTIGDAPGISGLLSFRPRYWVVRSMSQSPFPAVMTMRIGRGCSLLCGAGVGGAADAGAAAGLRSGVAVACGFASAAGVACPFPFTPASC